jgi:hypothetical protein
MKGLTLDAGALIALERRDRRVAALLKVAQSHRLEIAVPTGVVGQVWRDGARQSLLARLLGADDVELVVLDAQTARTSGVLCGRSGTADVIDASVVLCAREREHKVLTSEPDELLKLDASLDLHVV